MKFLGKGREGKQMRFKRALTIQANAHILVLGTVLEPFSIEVPPATTSCFLSEDDHHGFHAVYFRAVPGSIGV